MNEMNGDSIVNRDDPIPVLTISSDAHDGKDDGAVHEQHRDLGPQRKSSSNKLADGLSRVVDPTKAGSATVQDRLFST